MLWFTVIACALIGLFNFGTWYTVGFTYALWASGFCFGLVIAILSEEYTA